MIDEERCRSERGRDLHVTHLPGELGKQLSDPTSAVWALFTEFDARFYGGDLVGGDKKIGWNAIFQPIMPIPFTKTSKLITRPTLPIQFSVPYVDDPLGGDTFDRSTMEIGNLSLPILYNSDSWKVKMGDGGLALALGPTFSFPTATTRHAGSRSYEVGPTALVMYKNPKWTIGVFPQYFWSYADRNGDQPDTSRATMLYFLFYELGNAMQIGFAPTITYNDKAADDNKWNIPVGLLFAKMTKIGNVPVKFQVGVEYSIESPDAFGNEATLKLNVIPVVPALIKSPIF